jgi:hypothetical protein
MPTEPERPSAPSGTEAFEKLESLLDSGVLTREQYESELQRLKEATSPSLPEHIGRPFDN